MSAYDEAKQRAYAQGIADHKGCVMGHACSQTDHILWAVQSELNKALMALEEVASWENDAPARGERRFARVILNSLPDLYPSPTLPMDGEDR